VGKTARRRASAARATALERGLICRLGRRREINSMLVAGKFFYSSARRVGGLPGGGRANRRYIPLNFVLIWQSCRARKMTRGDDFLTIWLPQCKISEELASFALSMGMVSRWHELCTWNPAKSNLRVIWFVERRD
jgi:hypothetical protein